MEFSLRSQSIVLRYYLDGLFLGTIVRRQRVSKRVSSYMKVLHKSKVCPIGAVLFLKKNSGSKGNTLWGRKATGSLHNDVMADAIFI